MILVSACLCGENCKYTGGNNYNEKVMEFIKEKEVIYICPEQMGGLKTPRNPAEIIGSAKDVIDGKGKVISNKGANVTKEFLKGAYDVLRIAKENNVNIAVLKAKSPSCGRDVVYDGTFTGNKISGNGVTVELLLENGIEVLTEEMI
ncbi:MAG: DUF523 domain-containing protein [Sarcina sp.]